MYKCYYVYIYLHCFAFCDFHLNKKQMKISFRSVQILSHLVLVSQVYRNTANDHSRLTSHSYVDAVTL